MLLATLVAIMACSCGSSPVTLKGQIESLAMRTAEPVMGNLNSPVMNGSVPGSGSLVVIHLKGHEKDAYLIPLPQILAIQGFSDLTASAQGLGGLLALNPLQKRLNGKEVELTCKKTKREDGEQQYAVSAFQLVR